LQVRGFSGRYCIHSARIQPNIRNVLLGVGLMLLLWAVYALGFRNGDDHGWLRGRQVVERVEELRAQVSE
jgi:hypothetical protein